MNRVMGYCDRWSVAPGETVQFMVSCIGGDRYDAAIVRLRQPDAGPLATPFAPEPVAAPCNGSHHGRLQSIPGGSLAVALAATAWLQLPLTRVDTNASLLGQLMEAPLWPPNADPPR